MGKPSSSSSCLKIIACGRNSSVEDGNTQSSSEAKGSSEKRGWSFRKRSAKHGVQSNNVSSKNLTVATKETPQSTSIGSEAPTCPTISEKVLALEQPNEKCHPPSSFELKPAKSVEPELSEALDATKPAKPFELDAPKQAEPFGPDILERVDVYEEPELVEPKTFVSMGESKSLNPVELEVHGIEATFDQEPPESVEPKICVSAGESESVNLVEPEVHETEESPELLNLVELEVLETSTTSSSLEPSEQAFEEVVVPKPHVSTELKPSETMVSSQNDNMEEPIIIIIQAGIRRFLAQKELVKLRSTIQLQAAIRGHLVRRQAVDTLYCMQGIIKVQNLVRSHSSKANSVSVTKHITTKSSTEKLLKTAFARELLKSTPKSKSSIVKCDPLKPNYAWTWLERWMDVSSSGLADSETSEVTEEGGQSHAEKISPIMACEDFSKVKFESINPELVVEEASMTFEIEKSFISSDLTEEYQPSNILSSEEKMEKTYDSIDTSFEESLGMAAENLSMESNSHSQTQSDSLSDNPILETQEPRLSTERMVFEQVDVLSSAADNNASLKSPCQDESVEYHPDTSAPLEESLKYYLDTTSSLEESVHKEEDPTRSEAFVPDETTINIGGSECGTQLSVTSTLDSPDRSEAEVVEIDVKVKYLEEATNNLVNNEDFEVKVNGHSSVQASNSFSSTLSHREFPESNGVPKPVVDADSNKAEQEPEAISYDEHDNGEYVVLNMDLDSTKVEKKLERSAFDLQLEVGSQNEQPTYEVPLEATPNNNLMTIVESQGTPSSHVSVKTKRNKVDKSGSNKKHGSHSAGKRNVVKSLQNSGVRCSGEKLSKDQKNGKRRNSLGSTKYDSIDQEPRSSTSSIKALPSYMQATESAKAKANSPRSSPDVQAKDANFIKKIHSPRVHKPTTSQSPQPEVVKGDVNTQGNV